MYKAFSICLVALYLLDLGQKVRSIPQSRIWKGPFNSNNIRRLAVIFFRHNYSCYLYRTFFFLKRKVDSWIFSSTVFNDIHTPRYTHIEYLSVIKEIIETHAVIYTLILTWNSEENFFYCACIFLRSSFMLARSRHF